MSKTTSVRMDRENYEFLHEMAKEEGSDLSKAVRDTVTRGRILLAVEKYKKGETSLCRAAELAGVPLGQMNSHLVRAEDAFRRKGIGFRLVGGLCWVDGTQATPLFLDDFSDGQSFSPTTVYGGEIENSHLQPLERQALTSSRSVSLLCILQVEATHAEEGFRSCAKSESQLRSSTSSR